MLSRNSKVLNQVSTLHAVSEERKMRKKLDSMNYESKKHTRLDRRRIDLVNEIDNVSILKFVFNMIVSIKKKWGV